MSDKELIARLRQHDGWVTLEAHTHLTAAARIEALIAERDHWSDVAGREGVCMTCRGPNGAPEPYGCTDCLNTGYCGEHHNTVAGLEANLAKAVEEQKVNALEQILEERGAVFDAMVDAAEDAAGKDVSFNVVVGRALRAALAEIKGESHD